MNYNFRPSPPAEHKYSYSQTPQLASITGCIGCYIETIGGDPCEPGWSDRREDLYTRDLQAEFSAVLEALHGGVLADVETAGAFCRSHPECATNYLRYEHIFRTDTEKYAYILRLRRHRVPGHRVLGHRVSGHRMPKDIITYSAVIFCYLREELCCYMSAAEGGIRFVTSSFQDWFHLQDGDEIRITRPDGEERICACRYIDSYHFELNDYRRPETYHIHEFARLMERNSCTVIPLRRNLPEQCYTVDRTTGKVIVFRQGTPGWEFYGWSSEGATPQERADNLNRRLNVTKAQAAAMAAGALYGWDSPKADPAYYDEQGWPVEDKSGKGE